MSIGIYHSKIYESKGRFFRYNSNSDMLEWVTNQSKKTHTINSYKVNRKDWETDSQLCVDKISENIDKFSKK